jgi:hypothetical protein
LPTRSLSTSRPEISASRASSKRGSLWKIPARSTPPSVNKRCSCGWYLLAWPIHESRRLQMRGAEGEAVLILVKKRVLGLRTLRNKADAAGSARPGGKNAGSFETKLGKPNRK